MKKLFTVLFLFLTFNAFSQEVVDLGWHKVTVPDSISKHTVKRFDFYMRTNPINYEKYLREIKEIVMVDRDRYYVGDLKNGVIYLNSRLNKFPNTKEVVILHYLAVNSGMDTKHGTSAYVANDSFNITAHNEEMFRRQLKRDNPYKQVVEKLKEKTPLRSKL